jgi:hypothetical protein
MVNTKQNEHESLQDYTKQFQTAHDAMKSHVGGPLILTKFVEEMDKYSVLEAEKFRKWHLINLWHRCILIMRTKQNMVHY